MLILQADEGLKGERRLWTAIIAQAVADATDNNWEAGVRDEARQWLTTPSRNLAYVCELADLDMQRVIAFAMDTIAKADAKPAKPRRKLARRRVTINSRLLTFNGETLHLAAWAERLGITAAALAHRLDKRGWPVERALTTPASSVATPGVGRHPSESFGAGVGSTARDRTELGVS